LVPSASQNELLEQATPTERRRIIFSVDETVSAALSHCRSTRIAVPDAKVEHQDISTESDCSLLLTFGGGAPEQVHLDAETVLSTLVELCRLRSIPLPRAASKRLETQDSADAVRKRQILW
jgi:hypothetical protein